MKYGSNIIQHKQLLLLKVSLFQTLRCFILGYNQGRRKHGVSGPLPSSYGVSGAALYPSENLILCV